MAQALSSTTQRAPTTPEEAYLLVVDDDPQLRELMTEALGQAGFRVQAAPDGETALEMYHQHQAGKHGFDLVLLDLTLPSMSGGECMERIFEEDGHARVIITSGMAEGMEELPQQVAGLASGYLAKPFSLGTLLGSVKGALGKTASA